jgi:hypothetical protein
LGPGSVSMFAKKQAIFPPVSLHNFENFLIGSPR